MVTQLNKFVTESQTKQIKEKIQSKMIESLLSKTKRFIFVL